MTEPLPKIDRPKLRQELAAEFERVIQRVADAVDEAPEGRVIRDSEEPARDALDEFRRLAFQAAVQAKIDAAQKSLPPSGQLDDERSG